MSAAHSRGLCPAGGTSAAPVDSTPGSSPDCPRPRGRSGSAQEEHSQEMGLPAGPLLPTRARSGRFLAIRRRSRWQKSLCGSTHTHTSLGEAESHGCFCIEPFLLVGGKPFPQRTRAPHTRHLSPPPRSPSPSLTHRRAGACRGGPPLAKDGGVARAPRKVPAHPGSLLCVSSRLLRVCKSSDVLPPPPSPAARRLSHRDSRCP